MDEQVSRKAVIVFVMLALIISVLSTSLVLYSVYNFDPQMPQGNNDGAPTGRVSLSVPQQPITGKVVLEVINTANGE